jgi:putative sterol carrier protein
MADTSEFFTDYMPKKIEEKRAAGKDLVADVKAIIQFDVTGAGVWNIDLKNQPGSVNEGANPDAGCIITVAKADWEKIMDSPAYAMQCFMTGKLKASNVALAMQLQKILS